MPIYLPTELPPVGAAAVRRASAPPIFPSPDLQNGLVAGRLHLELPAFEMSISYLHGYAPLPGLTLTGLTLRRRSNPAVDRRRGRPTTSRCIGFDFSTALGDVLTLRGEAAYRRPVRLPEPALRRAPRPAVRARRRPHLRIAERHRAVPGALRVRLAEGAGPDEGPGRAGGASWRTRRPGGLHGPRHQRRQRRARADQPDPVLADGARAAHRHAALRVAGAARDAVDLVAVPATTSPRRNG